jgi:DhnA family fructose-bisphosphate aldolase class Ia
MYIASSITNINAEAGINSGHRKPAIIHTNTNTKLRKKQDDPVSIGQFDPSIYPT